MEEFAIFEALVRWLSHDLSSRVSFLPRAMKCVRFLFVPTKELAALQIHPIIGKNLEVSSPSSSECPLYILIVNTDSTHLTPSFLTPSILAPSPFP